MGERPISGAEDVGNRYRSKEKTILMKPRNAPGELESRCDEFGRIR
jgi:hypothetical protein